MALRDQPYLPLYVQDFMTDEKLIECSAMATGIYIRLLCIMHKTENYGTVLLKQKDKQEGKQLYNFACKLAKQMPWEPEEIEQGLYELVEEGVITIEGDLMYQKRMVKDNDISIKRSEAGKKGGEKTQFANKFAKAKIEANTETEYENENINTNKKGTKKFKPPTLQDVQSYFQENGYSQYVAKKAFDYYEANNWKDSRNKQIKNWKQKMIGVWFKDENKAKPSEVLSIQERAAAQERRVLEATL